MNGMRQVEFIPFWLTDEAEIYTIRIGEKSDSETHEFIMMFKDSVNPELKDDFARIFQTLKNISVNGAEENMFRPEGSIKDRVCALPLITARKSKKRGGTLRIYCIRVSSKLLIIGGGGEKTTQTYQEDPALYEKVQTLQKIDKILSSLEADGMDLNKEIINLTTNID